MIGVEDEVWRNVTERDSLVHPRLRRLRRSSRESSATLLRPLASLCKLSVSFGLFSGSLGVAGGRSRQQATRHIISKQANKEVRSRRKSLRELSNVAGLDDESS